MSVILNGEMRVVCNPKGRNAFRVHFLCRKQCHFARFVRHCISPLTAARLKRIVNHDLVSAGKHSVNRCDRPAIGLIEIRISRPIACRSVLITDKQPHVNSEGTNRSQNADGECGGFDKVTVTHFKATVTRSRSTVTLLRVTGTRFAAVTALKQRRIDILRISGDGRLYDLHP